MAVSAPFFPLGDGGRGVNLMLCQIGWVHSMKVQGVCISAHCILTCHLLNTRTDQDDAPRAPDSERAAVE